MKRFESVSLKWFVLWFSPKQAKGQYLSNSASRATECSSLTCWSAFHSQAPVHKRNGALLFLLKRRLVDLLVNSALHWHLIMDEKAFNSRYYNLRSSLNKCSYAAFVDDNSTPGLSSCSGKLTFNKWAFQEVNNYVIDCTAALVCTDTKLNESDLPTSRKWEEWRSNYWLSLLLTAAVIGYLCEWCHIVD